MNEIKVLNHGFVRFSETETTVLTELINLIKTGEPTDPNESWDDILLKQIELCTHKHLSNKREREECISKLEKIFLCK